MEVFDPETRTSCSSVPLTKERLFSSGYREMVCGGRNEASKTCIQLINGQWTSSVQLNYDHDSGSQIWPVDQYTVLLMDDTGSEFINNSNGTVDVSSFEIKNSLE